MGARTGPLLARTRGSSRAGARPERVSRLLRQSVHEVFDRWGSDAVLEVTASSAHAAERVAEEGLAAVRLFMRPYVTVNVERHRVGLVGEVAGGVREHVLMTDGDSPRVAPGFHRVGGTVSFRFEAAILDAWDRDPALQFLGQQLVLPSDQRTDGGRRAVTALMALDAGLRSLNPALRVLTAAMAVEVLYSREDKGRDPQATAVARRIAHLSCRRRCGRDTPLCLYTKEARSLKSLLADIRALHEKGRGWRCSAFLDVVAPDEVVPALWNSPLFTARNAVAHGGDLNLNDKQVAHLVRVANDAVTAGIAWQAAHPDETMADLDRQITATAPN